MAELALTFPSLLELPLADALACFRAAERRGFGLGLMSESAGRDAVAILAAVAMETRTLGLGTNVVPIYLRSPMQTAAAALTLDELSGGRLRVLGLGTSYRQRVEAWFGGAFDRPLARCAEYVDVVRALLRGGPVTYRGEFYRLDGYPALTKVPRPLPVYLGATGPRMRRLTGRVADGVILNSLSTPRHVEDSVALIAEGAAEAGRRAGEVRIGVSVLCAASDDRRRALEAVTRAMMDYLPHPELAPIVETTPFAAQVREFREAHGRGDLGRARACLTEAMAEAFTVFGTPRECRQKLDRYRQAGADLLVIRPCFDDPAGAEAVLGTIDALAPDS